MLIINKLFTSDVYKKWLKNKEKIKFWDLSTCYNKKNIYNNKRKKENYLWN